MTTSEATSLARPGIARAPGRGTRIAAIEITPVAFRDPPLLNIWGVHEPWALRTVIQIVAEDGLTGIGETYGDLGTIADLHAAAEVLVGLDPLATHEAHARVAAVCAPREPKAFGGESSARTASVTRLGRAFGGIEVALLDLAGKRCGLRICDLLGGAVRDRVPFGAYLFYKFARHQAPEHPDDSWGAILTPEQLAASARTMVDEHGFESLKVKGSVFAPEEEIAGLHALRAAFPRAPLRIDPNGGWTVETTMRHLPALETLVEYLEDPVLGMDGMAWVQARTELPLATNMCVVAFTQLPEAIRRDAVRIVLSDHHYWGGLRATRDLARICEVWGLGLSMHSNSHLGISLMAMTHVAAALPQLGYACDTHYPWLESDVLAGGPIRFERGCVALPETPGLGVTLDPDRLAALACNYATCGIRARNDVSEMRKYVPDWVGKVPRF